MPGGERPAASASMPRCGWMARIHARPGRPTSPGTLTRSLLPPRSWRGGPASLVSWWLARRPRPAHICAGRPRLLPRSALPRQPHITQAFPLARAASSLWSSCATVASCRNGSAGAPSMARKVARRGLAFRNFDGARAAILAAPESGKPRKLSGAICLGTSKGGALRALSRWAAAIWGGVRQSHHPRKTRRLIKTQYPPPPCPARGRRAGTRAGPEQLTKSKKRRFAAQTSSPPYIMPHFRCRPPQLCTVPPPITPFYSYTVPSS